MPPQLSIYRKSLKETPWVSKDVLLTSWNSQIDYKYGLTTHLTESQDLMTCHNELDASNSTCSAGGIHRHFKGMIHYGVSREESVGVTTVSSTQKSIEKSWIMGQSKPKRSCSSGGSSRPKSSKPWLVMQRNIPRPSNEDCNMSMRK